MDTATATATAADGPVVQSVRILFRILQAFTLLVTLAWATGNVRQVPPGTQAVVLRFGKVVRTQASGLVLALPRPLEAVERLPSAERQMVLKIQAQTARAPGIVDELTGLDDVPADAGVFMTGDGGVVLLDASVTWRIVDTANYYLASAYVAPALRRVFLAAATHVSAARQLDDFLAVRPERAADPAAQAARNAVRGELASVMNQRLLRLSSAGAGLGIEVTRVDVTALLPPSAKASFDGVLDATQRAEQGLATARTESARIRQQSDRDRDAALTTARAAAEERLARARAATAPILALQSQITVGNRQNMLDQVYRDRIGTVLRQAGTVNAVDGAGVGRVILPDSR